MIAVYILGGMTGACLLLHFIQTITRPIKKSDGKGYGMTVSRECLARISHNESIHN